MDTIKFVIEQYTDEEFGYTLPVINIYINDQRPDRPGQRG